MSPTGTPEFAITDGTLVPVKGSNENSWNRLGGYTVMLEAAYDVGPIEKGDLFYYAHMERESALPIGTKVRAGQRIGVTGDTGEGREVTRGKFPPHLHLGWYDASRDRTNLEAGAMNPYPLLSWLEAYGGAVTGGTGVTYCEALREEPVPSTGEDHWPVPDTPGTNPDLDTGERHDARPSPATGSRDRRDRYSKPGSADEPDEKVGSKKNERAGATDKDPDTNRIDESERESGTEDRRGGNSVQGEDELVANGDRTLRSPVNDDSLLTEIREKIRSILPDPSRFRDKRDADEPDEKTKASGNPHHG